MCGIKQAGLFVSKELSVVCEGLAWGSGEDGAACATVRLRNGLAQTLVGM
jgi:hypothetical protein